MLELTVRYQSEPAPDKRTEGGVTSCLYEQYAYFHESVTRRIGQQDRSGGDPIGGPLSRRERPTLGVRAEASRSE